MKKADWTIGPPLADTSSEAKGEGDPIASFWEMIVRCDGKQKQTNGLTVSETFVDQTQQMGDRSGPVRSR